MTLQEALIVVSYMQSRDVHITVEQKVLAIAWGKIIEEAQRIIRETTLS
jgi:hypothetical protein